MLTQYYHFTSFAMTLNELLPNQRLCPSDSRLRPDIRLMEQGFIDRASQEKTRLEEKQRESRKMRKSRKEKEIKAKYVEPYTLLDNTPVCNYILYNPGPGGSRRVSIHSQNKKIGFIVEASGRPKSISQWISSKGTNIVTVIVVINVEPI